MRVKKTRQSADSKPGNRSYTFRISSCVDDSNCRCHNPSMYGHTHSPIPNNIANIPFLQPFFLPDAHHHLPSYPAYSSYHSTTKIILLSMIPRRWIQVLPLQLQTSSVEHSLKLAWDISEFASTLTEVLGYVVTMRVAWPPKLAWIRTHLTLSGLRALSKIALFSHI